MKLTEAKNISPKFYPFIVVCILANLTINPMLEHLNKRGIFTNYWVINDDDEIRGVVNNTKAMGVMSDRPSQSMNILTHQDTKIDHLHLQPQTTA